MFFNAGARLRCRESSHGKQMMRRKLPLNRTARRRRWRAVRSRPVSLVR
jgi:hypothetical protein